MIWATRGIRPRSRAASADSLQYLHLSPQQVTNLPSHQAKTADGCLHPPQEEVFSHHHLRLPPTVNNCSGSSVSNTSPDRACSSSSVTMALYLSYKCTSAGREGAAFCCQHSQASIPLHLRSLYSNAAASHPSFHEMCSSTLCRDPVNLLFLFSMVLQAAHLLLLHHLAAQHPEGSRTQQMKPPSCAAPGSGKSTSHSLQPNICHIIPLELCLG